MPPIQKPLASLLTQRITLQEAVETADGAGGKEAIWQDKMAVWAYIRPLTSGDTNYAPVIADQVETREILRVLVRRTTAIRQGMRMQWRDKTYALTSVRDTDPFYSHIECIAEEIV